jgi:hypothetical protein
MFKVRKIENRLVIGLCVLAFSVAGCGEVAKQIEFVVCPGCAGADGADGAAGATGGAGLNCWDLNGDGACNKAAEDWNGPEGIPDGVCDAWDCHGPRGRAGDAGDVGATGQAGADGADGEDGEDGADGQDGMNGQDGENVGGGSHDHCLDGNGRDCDNGNG